MSQLCARRANHGYLLCLHSPVLFIVIILFFLYSINTVAHRARIHTGTRTGLGPRDRARNRQTRELGMPCARSFKARGALHALRSPSRQQASAPKMWQSPQDPTQNKNCRTGYCHDSTWQFSTTLHHFQKKRIFVNSPLGCRILCRVVDLSPNLSPKFIDRKIREGTSTVREKQQNIFSLQVFPKFWCTAARGVTRAGGRGRNLKRRHAARVQTCQRGKFECSSPMQPSRPAEQDSEQDQHHACCQFKPECQPHGATTLKISYKWHSTEWQ